MRKPFIMVAPTGARRGKRDHKAIPLTIPDIVKTASACHLAGADAIHLHIRDADANHSLDPGHYREAIAAINTKVPSLEVQVTTEAADRFGVAAQLHCIEALRPRWASVSIREMARDPVLAERLYGVADEAETRIQHILYDTKDVAQMARWQGSGVIRSGQTEVILVLGRYDDGPPSSPQQIAPFVLALPAGTRWMVCAFGGREHACLQHAATLGGDLRVGFENSICAPNGTLWRDSAASVAALVASMSSTSASFPDTKIKR
jgi:uncharacterized protein (DUF849 family)